MKGKEKGENEPTWVVGWNIQVQNGRRSLNCQYFFAKAFLYWIRKKCLGI